MHKSVYLRTPEIAPHNLHLPDPLDTEVRSHTKRSCTTLAKIKEVEVVRGDFNCPEID